MNTGDIILLCLVAIFAFAVIPWSAVVALKRYRTADLPREKKKIIEGANGYRRYTRYTYLIVFWAIVISIYIAMLDHAANDANFLGPKASHSRNVRLEIFAFLRTGLAVVHVPLLTSVLAATIPYWTMSKVERPVRETQDSSILNDSTHTLDRPMRLSQVFYLADKTWSGLIGWIQTGAYGIKEGGGSLTWVQLAVVAGLAYVGFPLLSLAYVTTSTQYWQDYKMSAPVSMGGLPSSYGDQLSSTNDQATAMWMYDSSLTNASLSGRFLGFNSSDNSRPLAFTGLANQTEYFPWADNKTMISVAPGTSDNIQLPVAGLRVFAQCGNILEYNSETDPSLIHGLGLQYGSESNNNGSLDLRCANNCSDASSSSLACAARSSLLNVTEFQFENQSGPLFNGQDQSYVTHFNFSQVGPSYQARALSCVQQVESGQQSLGSVAMAIARPDSSFRVTQCNISIGYIRPTINTLIGSYIDATSTSSPVSVLDANATQLLNLTISYYLSLFHSGPPKVAFPKTSNCTVAPITDGFTFVSNWVQSCQVLTDNREPFFSPDLNASSLLSSSKYSQFIKTITPFDERVFLGPLAQQFINQPGFFKNDTVIGVIFKTDQNISYGRVPAILAIVVLAVPILWTIALSVAASTERRWTSTLDAFAIFKLGGDWSDELKGLKMVSLSQASETVRKIPGNIVVDPAAGTVELGPPPRKRKVPKGEDGKRKHRGGWLSERLLAPPPP